MKITCTKENLNKSLDLVSHVASKSTNLPILNNVLLKAKDGLLELISTDLEIGIKSVVRGKIEEEGEFTLPASLFSNYINLLNNEKVELVKIDKEVIIQSEDSTTKIKGENADEFPLLPEVAKENKILVDSNDLRKAITQTVFAAAQDETRPEISGVLLSFNDEFLTIAATDSYRLAESKIKLKETVKENISLILPVKTLQELLRILAVDSEGDLEIYVNETQILFNYNETELISRIIEGQYPDYGQLIPSDFKTEITLEKNDFVKVIKTASLFTKSGINDVVLSVVPKDKLVLIESVNNQLGENMAKVEADITGNENKIVFNYRYLLDGLGAIDAEEIKISIIDSSSPGLIQATGQNQYLYIIMPIRQ